MIVGSERNHEMCEMPGAVKEPKAEAEHLEGRYMVVWFCPRRDSAAGNEIVERDRREVAVPSPQGTSSVFARGFNTPWAMVGSLH